MRISGRIESAWVAVNATLNERWGPLTENQVRALEGARANLELAYEQSTGRSVREDVVEKELAAVRER